MNKQRRGPDNTLRPQPQQPFTEEQLEPKPMDNPQEESRESQKK